MPGLLEEELVNSPTSEHDPSDTVESCISIDEEEDEAILGKTEGLCSSTFFFKKPGPRKTKGGLTCINLN